MNNRYGVLRAFVMASLALALAAPLGAAWAQPSGDHQRDARGGGSGHEDGPHGGAQAPRGANPPAPRPGRGAPNAAPGHFNAAPGHFNVAPRFHSPGRPGNAPVPNFQPAPQPAPARDGRAPVFRGGRGQPNAGPAGGRGGEPSGARGPFNGFAGGSARTPNDVGHFGNGGNGGRDAGQGDRGFAPNADRHDRGDRFDDRRDHDRGLAFGRPGERHYDRDHWEDHRRWDGGYWNGRYWPAIHDRANFVWLMPSLPVGYVTYSWDGVPYYYYNDTYYTWDPGYGGYVATEPPPVAEVPPPDAVQPDADDSDDQLYAYPMRGQSPEEQAEDREECQQWAYSQSPSPDEGYRRALRACLTGRGYSVD